MTHTTTTGILNTAGSSRVRHPRPITKLKGGEGTLHRAPFTVHGPSALILDKRPVWAAGGEQSRAEQRGSEQRLQRGGLWWAEAEG